MCVLWGGVMGWGCLLWRDASSSWRGRPRAQLPAAPTRSIPNPKTPPGRGPLPRLGPRPRPAQCGAASSTAACAAPASTCLRCTPVRARALRRQSAFPGRCRWRGPSRERATKAGARWGFEPSRRAVALLGLGAPRALGAVRAAPAPRPDPPLPAPPLPRAAAPRRPVAHAGRVEDVGRAAVVVAGLGVGARRGPARALGRHQPALRRHRAAPRE
jgi:hypothetical protein